MAKSRRYIDHSQEVNPEVQYERTDLNLLALLIFGAVMVVLAVVVFVLIWFMLKFWMTQDLKANIAQYGQRSPLAGKLPDSPQLEGLRPLEELRDWRAAGNATLNSSAWIDEKAGVVRIPIDQAIEQFVRTQSPSKPAVNPPSKPKAGAKAK